MVDTMDSSYKVYATWDSTLSWRSIVRHDTSTGLNDDLPDGNQLCNTFLNQRQALIQW